MSRNALLVRLLEALLDEWGGEEVQTSLARALSMRNQTIGQIELKGRERTRPAARPTATAIVEKAEIREDKRKHILYLAELFDRREFLPSVADVRQFIIMAGERPVTMKDRIDAFRALLKLLIGLPAERLEEIADAASNSGPAQLGPISAAIARAGERLPR